MNKEIITFSIRVPIETRAKLKILSAANHVTISRLLDDLISERWEKQGNSLGSMSIMHTASKELRKLLGK